MRKCTYTKVAYRPADSRESLPTRHCIVEQNYTYIVSHVNERSALTLLSSLRIVLRSRHGPPARPLYPRCDLRISYPETPAFFLLFFSRWKNKHKKVLFFFFSFYRVYVKWSFHTYFAYREKAEETRFTSLTIGTRKKYTWFRSGERNISSRTFFITRRKTQQVRGNAYT